MTRPGWLLGGAVLLAVAILAMAWSLGDDAPVTPADKRPPPTFTPPGGVFAPSDDPDASPLQRVTGAQFRSVGNNRVTILSFDSLEPRADYVSDFVNPKAELFFDDGRMLVIQGPAATIYHPANNPQRGSFDRDVVVTLYENLFEGQDPADARVLMRLFLDAKTNFDGDIGRIVSDGPVFLTGPDAEFTGQGLELTYNAARKRIESMTIERGESLRLQRPPSNNKPDPTLNSTPEAKQHEPSDPPVLTDPNASDAPQFYQAQFLEHVFVNVGPNEAQMQGHELRVAFALNRDSEKKQTGINTRAKPYPTPSPRLASANQTRTDAAPPLVAPPPRSLMPTRDNDIAITWTGPLHLTPFDTPPPTTTTTPDHLQHPDDAMLALLGSPDSPATLRQPAHPEKQGALPGELPGKLPGAQTITADQLRYFTATQRIEAFGTTDRPLIIDAPDQGRLTGIHLTLDPTSAAGRVQGPGQLLSLTPENPNQPALDLTFATHLDLEFNTDDAGELTALRRAIFQGDVHARAYDNDNEKTLPPEDPAAAQPALDLTAQTVIIDLTTDDAGKNQPTTLTARRGVLAQLPGRSIQADSLRAELAQKNNHKPRTEKQHPLTLAALRATGHISVHATTDDATLTGHRLVALPDTGQLTLTGTPDQHARIQTPDALLAAPALDFNDLTQTLLATGPGSLTTSDPQQQQQQQPTLHLAFDTQLHYQGNTGQATATGNVRATTHSPTESTRLESHQLHLTFTPNNNPQPNPAPEQPTKTKTLNLDLRSLHATPDPQNPAATVTFTTQTPQPNQPNEPATRLTLIGPDLFLENHPTDTHAQRVTVTGPGQMLLEDYRPPTHPKNKPENKPENKQHENPDTPALQLAGQGVTFFQWENQLNVNLHTNDLTMLGDVRMNHDPQNNQPRIRLFSDQLTADLTETQPLAAILNQTNTQEKPEKNPEEIPGKLPGAADPELRSVQLDGHVRVTQQDRHILADQLLFRADDRNVLLQAAPGRNVHVRDPQRGNLDADAILWNLDTDRIRITDYRGGVVPMP